MGRINVTEVMEWCFSCREVRAYFAALGMEGPETISQHVIQENEFIVMAKHIHLEGVDKLRKEKKYEIKNPS
jgi:hypothetical protein